MPWYADFSGSPPGASALRAVGFSGVWRYIGLGSEGKQIHAAEYRDYVANGITVALVAELGVDDAWASLNDYQTGQARAQLALDDARREGIPDSVIIACAADAHASSAWQITDAVAYARGFASVLGWERTGFYGFRETSQAVYAAGVCRVHWRAGSEPTAAEKQWVNFWQRNSPPQLIVVRGTQCDINEVYSFEEISMADSDSVMAMAWRLLSMMKMRYRVDLPGAMPAGVVNEDIWITRSVDDMAWRLLSMLELKETTQGGWNATENGIEQLPYVAAFNKLIVDVSEVKATVAALQVQLARLLESGVHIGATGEIVIKSQ